MPSPGITAMLCLRMAWVSEHFEKNAASLAARTRHILVAPLYQSFPRVNNVARVRAHLLRDAGEGGQPHRRGARAERDAAGHQQAPAAAREPPGRAPAAS